MVQPNAPRFLRQETGLNSAVNCEPIKIKSLQAPLHPAIVRRLTDKAD